MKSLTTLVIFCFLIPAALAEDGKVNWKKIKVLVFTKNGKGYVHDNIPFAVKCIQKARRAKWFQG